MTPPVLLKTVDLWLEMSSHFNCKFCFVAEEIFKLGNTTKLNVLESAMKHKHMEKKVHMSMCAA